MFGAIPRFSSQVPHCLQQAALTCYLKTKGNFFAKALLRAVVELQRCGLAKGVRGRIAGDGAADAPAHRGPILLGSDEN